MKMRRLVAKHFVPALLLSSPLLLLSASEPQKPHAKVVALESTAKELPILNGPPETVSMRSGLILLKPGEAVGKHTTGQHEEVLIVLEGKGEMRFHDGTRVAVETRHAIYCPPETEHDVVNTDSMPLRYVYVVASAK
jgi:mannose-6-phosphate isomerase-like protein (cupin superfamily)